MFCLIPFGVLEMSPACFVLVKTLVCKGQNPNSIQFKCKRNLSSHVTDQSMSVSGSGASLIPLRRTAAGSTGLRAFQLDPTNRKSQERLLLAQTGSHSHPGSNPWVKARGFSDWPACETCLMARVRQKRCYKKANKSLNIKDPAALLSGLSLVSQW